MNNDNTEYCFTCGEATGNPGRGDGSLYDTDDDGPYCSECWEKLTSHFRGEDE